MTKQAETSQPKSVNENETSKLDLIVKYKDRFEEAVKDAQYMMIHAATTCPNDINKDMLTKLINARQRVNNGEELTTNEEMEFWIAYQDLWKLVQPAVGERVTAESIKANMPLETTRLGNIPISKARGSVNRYIIFTVFILSLLLIFQIYWVIGNQLITELGTVSQTEEIFDTQQVESQQAAAGDTLDNTATPTEPKIDPKALKKKHDRYSAILQLWSKPWSWFFTVNRVNVEHDKKYEPLFAELDVKITKIDTQLQEDPDGMKAAALAAQKTSLEDQLNDPKYINDTKKQDELKSQIEKVRQKNSLDAQLLNLKARQETTSEQLKERGDQITTLNGELADLTIKQNETQIQTDDLNASMDYYQSLIANLETDKQVIQQIVDLNKQIATSTDDGEIGKLTEEKTTLEARLSEALKADLQGYKQYTEETDDTDEPLTSLKLYEKYLEYIEEQIIDVVSYKQYIEEQIASYNIEKETVQIQIDEKTKQIGNLNIEITNSEKEKKNIEEEIGKLKPQITTLESEITDFHIVVDPAVAQKFVSDLEEEKKHLMEEKEALDIVEQRYLDLTDSRPAQLAGQFVLTILQSYLLPILYGLLGAGTSVLRSLSRRIKNVTYSEEVGIQHLLSVSLGALAGIVVGWFSFLIGNGTTTFLGSVSPLAIAFLVGYNIELFFSRMDDAIKRLEAVSQQTAPTTVSKTTASKMDDVIKRLEAMSQAPKPSSKKQKRQKKNQTQNS